MASPRSYHSSSAASSSANLAPPSPTPLHKQQRRNTTPSLPPPSAIDLPEPVYGTREGHRRSPSPLRNSFTVDGKGSEDGSDDGSDGGGWGQRSRSPNPSITQMATDFAQRMGSFMNSRTGHLPTDAELEAEAQRERERSRREAERILMQEADERRAMEDKVLAMLQQTPSRPRAQTMPSPMETPSPSQKDKDVPGWWTAAKTKLTPTKEPLTPAQQVIQETKDRERKEKKEAKKRADKERKRSNEWPTTPEKYGDPAMEVLTTPPRRPVPDSPASGSGLSKPMSLPPSLAPSPLRSQDAAKSSTGSPSREARPLYAQFNPQGVLDVPATLLTIAKRFEKLEKWAVGHVRALEERMSDVERWLVDKEHERERESLASKPEAAASDSQTGTGAAITEIREEMVELQGRIGELGREMAKLATAPMNLSNGPSRAPAHVSTAPPTSSAIALPAVQQPSTPRRTPSQSHSRRESMSPPFIPAGVQQKETPRSRLPYPTGDYTSPTDIAMSPPGSPPPTLSVDLRTRPISIAGLPSAQNPSLSHSSSLNSLSGLPRAMSPPSASASPSARLGSSTNGGVNSSPTPRKRYTVALDAPIMKRSESPVSMSEESEDGGEETIGRAAARRNGYSSDAPVLHQSHSREASSHAREPSRGGRARPVSMMPGAATTPLRIRMRSQSAVSEPTDEEPLPPLTPGSSGTGRFVDPLVLRREKKEMTRDTAPTQVAAAAARRKMQVRELAAFFDKDKM